jgi:uroporphyrinogen III methyltransferase/synthase
LGEYAIKVDAIPREYRAEAIISGIGASSIKAARFLIPRAQVAREVLPAMLRNAGAREVVVAPVYRTTAPPKSSARAITKLIRDGALDLVTFTSSSTARNFAAMIGTDATRVPAAAIGPITSATARELGFRVAVEAKDYTTDGLTHAIVKYFAARRRKRR